MTPPPRLAIILSHPVQYYSPWFAWLRRHTALDFRVFYLWEFGVTVRRDREFGRAFQWDLDLLSGYDHEFVPNTARDPGTHHFRGLDNPALTARLAAWRPGAILFFGYNWLSHQRALWWARRRDIALLFRGDSHRLGRPRPGLVSRLALGLLYRQFDAFLTVGAANRDYFHTFGVPADRLFRAPHSVDATRFSPNDSDARRAAADLRARLGLGDRRVVLFAGKFHAGKDPVGLLRAYLAVATDRDALVFVGDGELRGELEALAQTRPDACVRFLPFANQTEMPSRYLLGDLFALPSVSLYETWGLAVNEAMHLERPAVVSDRVGCQQDLVDPGRTGWVFPAGDTDALAATLRTALALPEATFATFGRAAAERAAGYTYAQTTAGLLAALASLPRI